MRDLVIREALNAMVRDASERLRELVAAGQEIPYDLHESGSGSPLPRYVPLTERFIRDHSTALLELDSFGSACAAIESADLAAPYLAEFGITVPPDAGERAQLAATVLLCRLWADSTDFFVDAKLLQAAIDELEAGGEAAEDEIEVVVPLRGLQMPVVRLELATATIVRADTVDVPAEARSADGVGAAGWEPTFLAAARVGVAPAGDDAEAQPDAGARAVEAFRQLTTALRLFKAGGVALAPHAWTRIRADRWRRIATGAGRPRPGGYRLGEEELADLVSFSRAVAYRSPTLDNPTGAPGLPRALTRAISRFEAGLERTAVLEALNDYLLSLRFLLDGGGPAELGLTMRVAALCAEPDQRGDVKAIIDRALSLERKLWSGEPAPPSEGAPTPAQTAAAIEDVTRAILKDAICGHLGSDLRSTADEILLADGLAVGEGEAEQRGGPEEWDAAVEEDPEDREALEQPTQSELWIEAPDRWEEVSIEAADGRSDEVPLQVPEPTARIRVESEPDPEEENLFSNAKIEREQATGAASTSPRAGGRTEELLEGGPRARQRTAERVAYLFPRPETTEWDVRELSYDRRRRAELRAS